MNPSNDFLPDPVIASFRRIFVHIHPPLDSCQRVTCYATSCFRSIISATASLFYCKLSAYVYVLLLLAQYWLTFASLLPCGSYLDSL